MHAQLVSYINNRLSIRLSTEDEVFIRRTFTHKRLRKHQFLLEAGEVCRVAGFIVKGALKQYTLDEAGKENVLGLYVEGWWAGDRESFLSDLPSPFFIDACEDSDLLITNKDDFEKLRQRPFITDLMHSLTERQALQLLKRVHTTKTLSAEMRLADLEKNYPEFLQRFPQHIIASYLGMTKETLSRIRAQSMKK